MTIKTEVALRNFDFWGDARDNAAKLTDDQLDQVEEILEDANPYGITETEINDLFWFEFETICKWLGIDTDDDTIIY